MHRKNGTDLLGIRHSVAIRSAANANDLQPLAQREQSVDEPNAFADNLGFKRDGGNIKK
ncbi:MAG: hypothetical protein HKN47_13325 [Pirellulaceae bacterium]|nr:hypothetical protein [Pirellulaceae bacterium]